MESAQRIFTDEHKRRISASLVGRKAWNKGKKMSEETKKKVSNSKKGKPNTKLKGKKLTEEHIEKLRKAKREKPTQYWLGKKRPGMSGKLHPRWRGGEENRKMWFRKRRAMEKNAEGNHTLGEWMTLKAQYNWTCPWCLKKEPEISLTEDHIIPLSKGGSDNIENIQPLCRLCNSRKQARIIQKFPLPV